MNTFEKKVFATQKLESDVRLRAFKAAARASPGSLAGFAVNGRFLTQSITGVQRYATNIVRAMNVALGEIGAVAPIIAPCGARDLNLAAMPIVSTGALTGHLWEQAVLPVSWRRRLLNLCNTGPLAKSDQVVCIHDANVFVAPDSYGLAFRSYYRLVLPRLARSACITTVSNYSARRIARHLPVRASEVAVLPNGHEHALSWDPALARAAPSMLAEEGRSDRRFVLAIGSRARHKNLSLLVEAAPALAGLGIEIVIAGGEANVFSRDVLQTAPNIKMIRGASDHDLAFLMDRAVCLVFPSWAEGFGLPIIEAMARGCPVLSSDRASMPEICGTAALLASPADPAAWIKHVRALDNSISLREDLIGRGRERVRKFSWTESAAGYIDLLREPAMHLPARTKLEQPSCRAAVIVATRGRPALVSATVRHMMQSQTLTPSTVIVSCVDMTEAGDLRGLNGVTIVTGPPGLAAQRNKGLAALPPGIEMVAFFDDDFVADKNWLSVAARTFQDEPDVVAFTGHVVADDVKGPGLEFDEAIDILNSPFSEPTRWWIEPYSPYGCNMAFRASSIKGLRFDERLVLYGWLEDRDFAAALAKRGGRLIKCAEALGVHMGTKQSRVSGDRFGYSQIINPIYMLSKGTMTFAQVVRHIFRNVASNALRAARPEPFLDRRGRLKGNLMGMADAVRGRVNPERAVAIRPNAKS